MTPDVHALIVDHKKTFEDLFRIIKIDPVPMSNMLIVFHVFRSCVIVTYGSLWRGLSIYLIFRGLFRTFYLIIQFLFGHSGLK
jgi:hypothetical protein